MRRDHRRKHNPTVNPQDLEPNWTHRIDDFEEMNLNPDLVHGIFSYGFKHPSDIQSLAIEPILQKRHVLAQAQSGSGKTGAFGIGILNNVDVNQMTTQALILSPTRELATQTYNFMQNVGSKMKNLNVKLFIGGHEKSKDQNNALELPHVCVCTPGRASDLIKSGHLRVENITMLCIDEADQMLSDDFYEQVKEICSYLSTEVQILLFSATLTPTVFQVVNEVMRDPVKILVKAEKLTLEGIRQFFVNVGTEDYKTPTLLDIFGRLSIQKAVIFANSKNIVDFLKEQMEKQNFTVSAIHANMNQTERDRIMHQFRVGATRVLIATDLIARGIDVQQVTLVINFQLPKDRESYLHRIGRSGRYGRKGVAINICDSSEMNRIEDLQRFYHTTIEPLPEDIASFVKDANSQFDE